MNGRCPRARSGSDGLTCASCIVLPHLCCRSCRSYVSTLSFRAAPHSVRTPFRSLLLLRTSFAGSDNARSFTNASIDPPYSVKWSSTGFRGRCERGRSSVNALPLALSAPALTLLADTHPGLGRNRTH